MDGRRYKRQPKYIQGLLQGKSLLRKMKDRKQIITFFQKHKNILIVSFLLTAIVVLLLGIAGQLQTPATDDAPVGQTPIDYSTLVSQVGANNVLAVVIRGDQASVLLQKAPNAAEVSPVLAQQQRTQIATWTNYVSSAENTAWDNQTPDGIDASRMVYTDIPNGGSNQLVSLFISKHIPVTTLPVAQSPIWLGILLKFSPLLFMLILVFIAIKPRMKGRLPQNVNEHIAQFTRKQRVRRFDSSSRAMKPAGTPSAGSSVPASAQVKAPPVTTFADVAGIDEVRAELEEMVQFLRSPEKYTSLGARIPRGALLVGPPGTGKTLLARAVAGEAGVPFFSISASEFVEMFVGVGASRVRDLFAQARQAAPAVIFIDEIDAVGRKRSVKAMGNDERDQTLNQLLVEMDGFNERQTVVVLAATNRVDILDKALLRPGRFDRHVTVSLPDRVGRQAILGLHTARTPLAQDVSLERLARLTTGMSGADLANLVNEAALCAARKNLTQVDQKCFDDALARVQLGALRPLIMSETERRIIAYHEGGHALVAHYLQHADLVNQVTILPRGQSLGVTQFIAEEDRYNYSREMLIAKIAVGLGGRVAEELTLGPARVTTGAENDFQVVTGLARRMVTRWGMSENVGVVFTDYDETGAGLNMRRIDSVLASRGQTLAMTADGQFVPNGQPDLTRQYSFALAAPVSPKGRNTDMAGLIDREVKAIIEEGRSIARQLLQEHFADLHLLADVLMEREQLNRTEFEQLLEK